jgi:hypothetical protein
MTKLIGSALLSHRAESRAKGISNPQIVRDAGYAYVRKDGIERVHFTEYYENVLIAQGKMWRICIDVAEITSMGAQPIWSDSFTTSNRSARSIARKVRAMTKLTGVKCKRTVRDGVVALYPYRSDEMVMYNLPA